MISSLLGGGVLLITPSTIFLVQYTNNNAEIRTHIPPIMKREESPLTLTFSDVPLWRPADMSSSSPSKQKIPFNIENKINNMYILDIIITAV